MLRHLIDDDLNKNLPILNMLYNFINQKESAFEIEFNDILGLK